MDRNNKGALFHFIELIFQRKLDLHGKLARGQDGGIYCYTTVREPRAYVYSHDRREL